MLEIGELAPDFELISDSNESVRLSDFRGQRVLLFFYPKAGTSGCTTQACGFRDNFPRIEAANATVLGVSPDTPQDLAQWKEEEDLPYTLLADTEHDAAKAYDVWGKKKMFGNEFMGVIRSHFIIDEEGRLEDVQYKISPKKSIEKALEQLEQ